MAQECKQCEAAVVKKIRKSKQATGAIVIPYERPKIEGAEAMPEMVTIKMAKGYVLATHCGHPDWPDQP